jgi:D-xylonolactonase
MSYNAPMPQQLQIESLTNQHCNCGENPYWHPDDQCVYWTDIPEGKLFRFDPATREMRQCYSGPQVGGFTLQADGKFLLFRVGDVATFDPKLGHVETIIRYTDDGMTRFNDVHADRLGRVYAGTMGKSATSGGLYLIGLDRSVRKLVDGTGCSNGLAFSPDERWLYWQCSTRRKIFRFRWDAESGNLFEQSVFYDCPPEEGIPDGTAMDEAGNLWSTRWDGHRICIIDTSGDIGRKTDEIRFPVAKVSCAIFGGREGNELFVTTAGGKPDSDSADGTLYRIVTQTRGRPRFQSRVGL